MTILSVYNIKGGVGKTATAVNLSYLAATENISTLLCDLDPQSSATYYFRVKPKMKTGLKPLVKGKKSLEKNIALTLGILIGKLNEKQLIIKKKFAKLYSDYAAPRVQKIYEEIFQIYKR